jgi:hypothetical protein
VLGEVSGAARVCGVGGATLAGISAGAAAATVTAVSISAFTAGADLPLAFVVS